MAGYNLGDAELTTSVNLDGLKGGNIRTIIGS